MEKDTLIKTNPEKKNTLKLKGVTKKQISLMKEGKLPIAVVLGLLGGVGSQYVFVSASGKIDPVNEEATDESFEENSDIAKEECFDFEAPTTIEFSDAVSDDMSYGEAFSAARQDVGAGGFFNWHGSSYHTLTKEEWDAMPDDQKQEFLDKIQEHTDFGAGEYNKIEEDIIDEDVIDESEEEVIDEKEEEVIDKKKEEVIDEKEEEVIDEKEEEVIDEKKEVVEDSEKWKENIPDEISYDDLIYDETETYNEDSNVEDDNFVEVSEIGDTADILEGLNDGEATTEEDGIAGGDTFNPDDYDTNNTSTDSEKDSDMDIEYDDNFGDDSV